MGVSAWSGSKLRTCHLLGHALRQAPALDAGNAALMRVPLVCPVGYKVSANVQPHRTAR